MGSCQSTASKRSASTKSPLLTPKITHQSNTDSLENKSKTKSDLTKSSSFIKSRLRQTKLFFILKNENSKTPHTTTTSKTRKQHQKQETSNFKQELVVQSSLLNPKLFEYIEFQEFNTFIDTISQNDVAKSQTINTLNSDDNKKQQKLKPVKKAIAKKKSKKMTSNINKKILNEINTNVAKQQQKPNLLPNQPSSSIPVNRFGFIKPPTTKPSSLTSSQTTTTAISNSQHNLNSASMHQNSQQQNLSQSNSSQSISTSSNQVIMKFSATTPSIQNHSTRRFLSPHKTFLKKPTDLLNQNKQGPLTARNYRPVSTQSIPNANLNSHSHPSTNQALLKSTSSSFSSLSSVASTSSLNVSSSNNNSTNNSDITNLIQKPLAQKSTTLKFSQLISSNTNNNLKPPIANNKSNKTVTKSNQSLTINLENSNINTLLPGDQHQQQVTEKSAASASISLNNLNSKQNETRGHSSLIMTAKKHQQNFTPYNVQQVGNHAVNNNETSNKSSCETTASEKSKLMFQSKLLKYNPKLSFGSSNNNNQSKNSIQLKTSDDATGESSSSDNQKNKIGGGGDSAYCSSTSSASTSSSGLNSNSNNRCDDLNSENTNDINNNNNSDKTGENIFVNDTSVVKKIHTESLLDSEAESSSKNSSLKRRTSIKESIGELNQLMSSNSASASSSMCSGLNSLHNAPLTSTDETINVNSAAFYLNNHYQHKIAQRRSSANTVNGLSNNNLQFKLASQLPPLENGEIITLDIETYRLLLQDMQDCKLVLYKLASLLRDEPANVFCNEDLPNIDEQDECFSQNLISNLLRVSFYFVNSLRVFLNIRIIS
jgi:hypothetical protein